MTTAEFVKHYDTPARAAAAARHYRWLADNAQPLRLPALRSADPASMAFEWISGRHADVRDLRRLAGLLGDAHGAAWENGLRHADLRMPHPLADGGSVGDFLTSRLAALNRRLKHGFLPDTSSLHEMLALLEGSAAEPAAFYKDSNPRNFLITADGTIFTIDTDDLTLAPFGYDLAKLVVTLAMTYGEIYPSDIEAALDRYNQATAQHGSRLGVTPQRLEEFIALHDVLTAPYSGRHGYRRQPRRPARQIPRPWHHAPGRIRTAALSDSAGS